MRWRGLLVLGALLLLSGPAHAFGADAAPSKEDRIKAAFLYNFTKYVEWPVQRFGDDRSPIVIGVLGTTPIRDELAKIVKDRTVSGRAILVKLITTADEVSTVHLLFVPAGEETRLPAAIWENAAVVAVGESEGFAALGGTITFTREPNRVRFAINLESAERTGLKISAQLLKLASEVHRKS